MEKKEKCHTVSQFPLCDPRLLCSGRGGGVTLHRWVLSWQTAQDPPCVSVQTRRLLQDLNTNVTLGALCAHYQATVYSPSNTPTFASLSTPTLSSGFAWRSSASVSLICVSLDRFFPCKFSKWSLVVFNGSFIDIKAVLSFQRCPFWELIWCLPPGMWRVCLYFSLTVVTRSLVRIILPFLFCSDLVRHAI